MKHPDKSGQAGSKDGEPPPRQAPAGASIAELFQLELEQQVAAISCNLLELDRGQSRPEVLQNLMRAAHSLKGAARIANRRAHVRIAHQMEECFLLAQHGAICLGRADVDILLKVVDFLAEQREVSSEDHEDDLAMKVAGHLAAMDRIAARSSGKSAAPAPAAHLSGEARTHPPSVQETGPGDLHPVVQAPDRYLRLATESLNRLLGLANESLVEARWLRPFANSLQHLATQHALMGKSVEKLRLAGGTGGPGLPRAELDALARQLHVAGQTLSSRLQELEAFDQRAAQMSRRLYMEVLRARMRPLSDFSRHLPRMVRDLARLLGKNVRLELLGESTHVDREVLDRLEAPLVHLLRNAVDHGCESPEARKRAGKPAECVVRVEARHNGGTLLLRVADDGMGIDPALLRRQIAEKGLADGKHLSMLSDTQLLDYLFVPGFTIRETATEISGRGIGLDVVHTAVRNLRGNLRVINRPGRGLEFQMQLPLTISVIRALLVEVDHEPYALPLGRISRVAKLTSKQIEWIQGTPYFRHCGRHIALAQARQLFGCDSRQEESPCWQVVVLGETEPRFGLVVDAFIGERELLVQPLDPRIGKVRDVAGAALMDDGTPLLILDVQELVRSIERLSLLGRLASRQSGS